LLADTTDGGSAKKTEVFLALVDNPAEHHKERNRRPTRALVNAILQTHNRNFLRKCARWSNLVDVLLSERQDQAAAEAFFRSARTVTGGVPDQVTTDGHSSYPGAIKAELGDGGIHRTNRYLNNHLEQDHRGVKQRTRPLGDFKRFVSAARFCRVYDEVRNFFRVRSQRNEPVSWAWQRTQHLGRLRVLMATLAVA
jgi:putative transposase